MRNALLSLALCSASCAGQAPAPTSPGDATPLHQQQPSGTISGLSCAATLPDGGALTVAFDGDAATSTYTDKEGSEPVDQVHPGLAWTWDGHLTGTAKAPGLELVYESHYGCVRNARLTLTGALAVGPVDVALCQGGGTDDDLCAGR
jgi:hypothetical protein